MKQENKETPKKPEVVEGVSISECEDLQDKGYIVTEIYKKDGEIVYNLRK